MIRTASLCMGQFTDISMRHTLQELLERGEYNLIWGKMQKFTDRPLGNPVTNLGDTQQVLREWSEELQGNLNSSLLTNPRKHNKMIKNIQNIPVHNTRLNLVSVVMFILNIVLSVIYLRELV